MNECPLKRDHSEKEKYSSNPSFFQGRTVCFQRSISLLHSEFSTFFTRKNSENIWRTNWNQLGIKSGKTAKINGWTKRASFRKPFLDVQASMWDILIWFGNLSTIAARVMVNGSVPFQKCKYEGDIEWTEYEPIVNSCFFCRDSTLE